MNSATLMIIIIIVIIIYSSQRRENLHTDPEDVPGWHCGDNNEHCCATRTDNKTYYFRSQKPCSYIPCMKVYDGRAKLNFWAHGQRYNAWPNRTHLYKGPWLETPRKGSC